jgi:hypothetical protein
MEDDMLKQEILCLDCALTAKKQFTTRSPYAGEYVKVLMGIARNSFVCDQCAKPIPKEFVCAAFSIWSDRLPFILGWKLRYISPIDESAVKLAIETARRMEAKP